MCKPRGGGARGKAGALGACEVLVQSRLQVAQWGGVSTEEVAAWNRLSNGREPS